MTPAPTYNRAPSPELQEHLSPGGFLAPLLALSKRKVARCHLDVHLRLHDKVIVYCGLTKLVDICLKNGMADFAAESTYTTQPCAGDLFRVWNTRESGFEEVLSNYLDNVAVDGAQTGREGGIQARWSRVTEPWIPFDRDAVLAYESETEKAKAMECQKVDEAYVQLGAIVASKRKLPSRKDHWAMLPQRKKSNEIDQIAVDPQGRLVIVELKDASASDVYYAPLQLLQYVWEWHNALGAVRDSLQRLLDARVALGLTPVNVPRITGGVRAAIGLGDDDRNEEVKRRYERVLAVVNTHLPSGVPPIETWKLRVAGPPDLIG